MFPVDRIRNYRRHLRKLSPNQKDEFRMNLLVVLGISPLLLYLAELPIFLPESTISFYSAFLVGTFVPITGMATRIKYREIRTLAVGAGFIGLSLSAFTLLQSTMEIAQKILSRDVTTLDFKSSGILFGMTLALTAIGLIHDRRTKRDVEDPPTDPRRYM